MEGISEMPDLTRSMSLPRRKKEERPSPDLKRQGLQGDQNHNFANNPLSIC